MTDTIPIGKTAEGRLVELSLLRLIDSRALIQASSGGGKSYLLRLLAERTAASVPFLLIDPEGEFATLREALDLILVGQTGEIQANPRTAAMLARRLAESNSSAVIDLSELDLGRRRSFVRQFCMALIDLPRALWHPRIVAIDEAHIYAPERSSGESEATSAVISLMSMGRKRGLCGILATQRISKLHKDAAAEAGNVFTGRTTLDIDQKRAADILGMSKEDRLGLRDLADGEWFAFGPALKQHGVVRFRSDRVKTTHPKAGERHKLKPPPPSASVRGMVAEMADLAARDPDEAVTLEDAQGIIGRLKGEHRKRITDLERQLKAMPAASKPEAKIERIEVPMLAKGDQAKLEKQVERLLSVSGDTAIAAKAISDALFAAAKTRDLPSQTSAAVRNGQAVAGSVARQRLAPPHRPTPRLEKSSRNMQRSIQQGGQDTELSIGKCHRAILSVLAQHGPSTSGRLTLLAGYRYSGGFKNSLSDLRTAGLIEGENTGVMQITEAGRSWDDYETLPTGEALQQYWLNHSSVGACERAILEALIAAHPESRTAAQLCEETEYQYSGGFKNALSNLRTAGLIVGRNTEAMRASETLFERGNTTANGD